MARLEPSGTLVLTKEVRRLYDLPVFTAAGTLSITSFIPFIFQVAGVLTTLVTRPAHGPRLYEAAASSVQICSQQICHPNHLLV